MSSILNIDTAVQTSSVCVAQNDQPLFEKVNPSPKDSAAWLHVAIEQSLTDAGIDFHELDAIAVSEGPGSYTGLRVGMAAAKGLCYALNKPLITVNSLKMMAVAAVGRPADLLCPMIDARRMEVFTALFDQQLNFIWQPRNLILNETSFFDWPQGRSILFFGNGSAKFQPLIKHPNALFDHIEASSRDMVSMAYQKFLQGDFANLAYSQPFYGKDFYSPTL